MTISHTDNLLQKSAGAATLVVVPGVWVRLLNNSTSTNYYSAAVTDVNGAFTHSAVPGDYSLYYGGAATVPGTPTLINAHYPVSVTAGDDVAASSYTALSSSPYAPAAGIAAGETVTRLNPYNVKAFGALGNGVADDGPACSAAVVACAAAGGGVVFFPPGIYLMGTANLDVPPNVSLEGSGIDVTVLRIKSGSFAAYANGFIVQCQGELPSNSNCHVRDLTLDGNARSGTGIASAGGLMQVGNYWTVERVRFYDGNWFKLYAQNTIGVRVRFCRWDNTASGNDEVGGGGNTDMVVENNFFDSTIAGNCFDHVGGSFSVYRNNYNASVKNMFYEGITDSLIEGNYTAGGIVVQDNSGYSPTIVTNPKNNIIRGNVVNALGTSTAVGIQLRYGDYAGATTHNSGGGNIIENNEIHDVAKVGVLVFASNDALKTSADIIRGNKVVNPNTDGSNDFNTGSGIVACCGVALAAGWGDIVQGNSVIDLRTPALMRYGYSLGYAAASPQVNTVNCNFVDNSSSKHTLAPIQFLLGGTLGNKIARVLGYNPVGNVTAPGIPATTVVTANPNQYDCTVHVAGGTLTAIGLGGLPTPVNATFVAQGTGGTLIHSTTYFYRVTALNVNGETLASTETSIATPAGADTCSVIVKWAVVAGATGYNVYGRTTGAETKITASINTQALQYIDTGSALSGALPGADTTGNTATGITAAAAAGSVHSIRLPAGSAVKLTYTVAPTWTWFGD